MKFISTLIITLGLSFSLSSISFAAEEGLADTYTSDTYNGTGVGGYCDWADDAFDPS